MIWRLKFKFPDSVPNVFLLLILKTQMVVIELTCQKSLQLHLPHRVPWLVTKSSGYNLPQILWNLLPLLGKTITRQLEHIIFCNTIYSKFLAVRICKLQNPRFLHSLSTVGDQEAVTQLLKSSEPIQPADEKSRQWVTKWSKWAAPCMDFRLWTPTTFCCYKITWKRFLSMLLDLYAVLPCLPPPSHQSFLF